MSREHDALLALRRPPGKPRTGDMWLYRRMGMVIVFTGHRRGSRKGQWPTCVDLYHMGKPSLTARPCEWRDNDNNAYALDPANKEWGGEKWVYVGNIFDRLPYHAFDRAKESQ